MVRWTAFAVVVAVSACTTERVETKLDQFSSAVRATSFDVEKLLEPGIASEAETRLVQAGKNRDFWQLSGECRDVIAGTAMFPIEACQINRKVRFPDQPYRIRNPPQPWRENWAFLQPM